MSPVHQGSINLMIECFESAQTGSNLFIISGLKCLTKLLFQYLGQNSIWESQNAWSSQSHKGKKVGNHWCRAAVPNLIFFLCTHLVFFFFFYHNMSTFSQMLVDDFSRARYNTSDYKPIIFFFINLI